MSAVTAPNGNGTNGRRDWKVILGVPGAVVAALTVAIMFHTWVAGPAIERGSRAAVRELLSDPTFWSSVREAARLEAKGVLDVHERAERELAGERAKRAEQLEQAAAEVQARLRELERRR